MLGHDPEQGLAVFQKDRAQSKTAMTVQPNLIALQDHLLSGSRSRCERKSAIERRLAEISGPHIPKIGTPDMEIRAKTGTIDSLAPILILLLLGSPAVAQNPKPKDSYIKNIEACNGLDRTSFEARIAGCTALIDEHQVTTTTALATAYSNRGNAYAAKRDYDRAIQDFDQSIKLNPTYSKPFNNSGVAYLKKGEYDLAIEAFDQAIRLNRNYGEALANRAGAYLKKNEYARAARDYDEAIRIEPDLQGVWNGRCWTRAILGALQGALEDCNKAIQSDSSSAATYDSRGLIYLKTGRVAAASAYQHFGLEYSHHE